MGVGREGECALSSAGSGSLLKSDVVDPASSGSCLAPSSLFRPLEGEKRRSGPFPARVAPLAAAAPVPAVPTISPWAQVPPPAPPTGLLPRSFRPWPSASLPLHPRAAKPQAGIALPNTFPGLWFAPKSGIPRRSSFWRLPPLLDACL